jgi:beta-lactamase regulating signal transducer with metallopeptidase domain
MSDVVAFFVECFRTPALLTSACALVIVPPLAWLVVRALAPMLGAMDGDRAWQAPLAAAAAALPAFLFAVIGVVTLRDAWGSVCLQFVTGRVLYAGIAAITVLGLIRATVLLRRRTAEYRDFIARSAPASPALAQLAAQHALTAGEIESGEAFILLAGIRRPVVLVSTEALNRLDAAQLDAAVRHEAAHAHRGDQAIAAMLTFVSDIIPLPVGDLIALYRRAREFAADAHAVRTADPCDLAGALLALARGGKSPLPAAASAFAEAGTVRVRLAVLLSDAPAPPSLRRRALVAGTLATTFALGAAPSVAALINGIHCTLPMSRMS